MIYLSCEKSLTQTVLLSFQFRCKGMATIEDSSNIRYKYTPEILIIKTVDRIG